MERVPSDKDKAEETASNATENEEAKCQRPGRKVQMHSFKIPNSTQLFRIN